MTEIKIRFKDKNRADLKLKLKQDYYIDYCISGLIRVPVAANGKVSIWKSFSADSIEEITEVIREEGEEDTCSISKL